MKDVISTPVRGPFKPLEYYEALPAHIRPSLQTDAAPPERDCKGLIVLAGAIKWWWLTTCRNCWRRSELPQGNVCPTCDTIAYLEPHWDSEEHKNYVEWRKFVRSALINAGWFTYAPHEAFKGTWMERAQIVNDAAIQIADWILVMSPAYAITDGTDEEVAYAQRVGTGVAYALPGEFTALARFL